MAVGAWRRVGLADRDGLDLDAAAVARCDECDRPTPPRRLVAADTARNPNARPEDGIPRDVFRRARDVSGMRNGG